MRPVHAKAEDYFERFCSDLGLPPVTVALCHTWIKEVRDKELDSGRGPVGIAAALIYMASIKTSHRRTQREIADATNVTEVTIRNRYKELTAALNLELEI
jgi:transcription initiation factor TFIIB